MKKSKISIVPLQVFLLLITCSLVFADRLTEKVPWGKCPRMGVNEVVEYLIKRDKMFDEGSVCFRDGVLSFVFEGEYRSVIEFNHKRRFSILAINSYTDEKIVHLFRRFELELLDKIGTPEYFHKRSGELGIKSMLLLVRRGAAEFRTVWQQDDERLILLLNGEDLEIFLSCGWH